MIEVMPEEAGAIDLPLTIWKLYISYFEKKKRKKKKVFPVIILLVKEENEPKREKTHISTSKQLKQS